MAEDKDVHDFAQNSLGCFMTLVCGRLFDSGMVSACVRVRVWKDAQSVSSLDKLTYPCGHTVEVNTAP